MSRSELARTMPTLELGQTFTGIGQEGVGGDVWFREGFALSAFAGLALHEIGHALGLKHPTSGVLQTPPYLNSAEGYYSFSAMVTGEATSTYQNLPVPTTFSIYELAELQYLYGAGNANTGDSTYSFGGASIRATIWDSGGTDTISAGSELISFGFTGAGTVSRFVPSDQSVVSRPESRVTRVRGRRRRDRRHLQQTDYLGE